MTKPFTDLEMEQLRELLSVADTVRKEAEYKIAVRLVIKTWKNIVIGAAATIAAVILLRDQIKILWSWFIGG